MRGNGEAIDLSDSEQDDDDMLNHENGEEVEEEDLTQWTVDTFKPRPVGGEGAANSIRSMYTKMSEPLDRIDETLRLFGEVAAAIADCDEKHHMIRQVQNEFLATLETRYLIQIKVDVLKMLEARLKSGTAIEGIEEEYNSECQTRLDEWSGKSQRAKYKSDKNFEQFRTAIWEKNHPDEPLGPIARYLEKDEKDESGSDDEVEAGGTIRNYQCPLTRKTLKDAHTSSLCGHSYTGQHIMEMLNSNKRKGIKCPVAGCGHQLFPKDVQPDPALQKHADAYAKKQEQRERHTARARNDADDEVVDSD